MLAVLTLPGFQGISDQVICADFWQSFILYLSHTVRTTVKIYFDKTVAKDKLS